MIQQTKSEQVRSKERRISWVVNSIMLIGFLGTLFYGLAVYAFGTEQARSDSEGRMLAQRPEPTVETIMDGSYMEGVEASANDQVFERYLWIETQAWVQRNVLQQQMNNGVISIDEFLYSPDPVASDYSSLGVFFKKFKQEMDEAEIPSYFASAPSKPVYATRQGIFPAYIESADAQNRGQLHERLKDNEIPLIDLEETLGDKTAKEIYFKTDHHWRPEGAFLAYGQIMDRLREQFPDAPVLTAEQMETKTVDGPFYGSHAREISMPYVESADTFTYLEPKDGFTTTVCRNGDDCGHPVLDKDVLKNASKFTNYYNIFMGDNYAQAKITQKNPKNDYHLLVLKDSYANPVLGYLGESFGTVSALDVRYFDDYDVSIADYAKENDVDAVLFVHNDRIRGLGSMYQRGL
ncbi:DHHW family protein [Exiguobacterium sp. s48]|uniref:DHHW family protein n=1 Tax=Exiguobacterium sp. s48 TaxID=2751273 RepID=UPI001BE7AE8B|nr:DHHW family protein [Exiguobacterium sp. s48]